MRLQLHLLAGLLLVSTTGCAANGIFKETFALFRPNPEDHRDTTDEPDPQWDSFASEARSDRPLDYEEDPFDRIFMSDRARSIKRSLRFSD